MTENAVLTYIYDQDFKRAAVSGATSGDNTLVAAVSGKKVKVLGLVLVADSTVAIRLESGASGTALTGVMTITVTDDNPVIVLPMTTPGSHWVETAAGALLNMELGGAVQVSGCVVYYLEE